MQDPPERISSPRNSRYHQWRNWVNDPSQKSCPWLPFEGWKAVRDATALSRGRLVVATAASLEERPGDFPPGVERIVLTERLFRNLSGLRSPQGILVFVDKPSWSWKQLPPRLLYLDGIQDPGNLGTIIRTAAAVGHFGLVSSPGTVSFFNPKVLRATAGYLFRVPFRESVDWIELTSRGYPIWLMDAKQGQSLFDFEMPQRAAVVVGSEGSGAASMAGLPIAGTVTIPMSPGIESLNAGVAAALMMYHSVRTNPPEPEQT